MIKKLCRLTICLALTLSFTANAVQAANAFGTKAAETKGKHIGNSNPLYTQHYGADPWAMEYDGRLYVYMTNDTYEYDSEGNIASNKYGTIRHINVISSADMVNWTDHGSIPVAGINGIAKWANNS